MDVVAYLVLLDFTHILQAYITDKDAIIPMAATQP